MAVGADISVRGNLRISGKLWVSAKLRVDAKMLVSVDKAVAARQAPTVRRMFMKSLSLFFGFDPDKACTRSGCPVKPADGPRAR
jgi:hypothetical protein